LISNVQRPTAVSMSSRSDATSSCAAITSACRVVALQVAFERQPLKPIFHLVGFRLRVWKVIGYGMWVNLIQPAEPHRVSVANSPSAAAARAASL
jgi:hypothetical protein